MIIRKSDREVETMARAGEVVAETLTLLEREAQPGVTLLELDELAEAHIRSRGGVPSFKGFRGFPGVDLRVAQRHGRARHPRPLRARARRSALA